MADASKLKYLKKTLGHAPTLEQASKNLTAPELAPLQESQDYSRILDGRSMRKTNRTVRFATCVTVEFDHTLRKIALEKKMLLSEVLEEALRLYNSRIDS
jgi:hypothetical protein